MGIFKTCHAHGNCLGWLWMALVGTGWTTSHLVSTNRCVKITPLPLKGIISGWSGGAFSGRRAMSIENSLVSGCGQGHKSPEFASKKLWLPVLTESRSGNTAEARWLQRS